MAGRTVSPVMGQVAFGTWCRNFLYWLATLIPTQSGKSSYNPMENTMSAQILSFPVNGNQAQDITQNHPTKYTKKTKNKADQLLLEIMEISEIRDQNTRIQRLDSIFLSIITYTSSLN